MPPTNVLLVLADQWRAQACGYAGNPVVHTPHLDAFARTAVNCPLAVSGCPVCTPARASLLTSLRPDRHGLFLNDAPLDPTLPSLGKHLRASGYRTAFVGKWHVDGHGRKAVIPAERRHGFDYWKVLECTHDYHASDYYAGDETSPRRWQGYDAIAQTDDLIAWIKAHDGKAPFAAVLSWGPPHNPYLTAPEDYRRRYDPATVDLAANVPEAIADGARLDLAGYYGHCTALDDCFGRLLATLNRLGIADNTLVLFTSDHGDFIGAHGLYDKQGPWDEAIRVPFLLQAPGLPRGTRNHTVIDWIDFWPTLCGLLDLPLPTDIQGRDHSRHLRDGNTPQDNSALYGCYHVFGNWPRYANQSEPLYHAREARGLRDERYTFITDRNGPWLLYDNHEDPAQLYNRIDDPTYRGLRDRFQDRLNHRLRQENDDFPAGLDLVRRWGYRVGANGTLSTADFCS